MKTPLLATLLFLLSPPVAAVQLITEFEASLPPPPSTAFKTRGITRGPAIRLLSPETATPVKSPFSLKMTFEARGGASIDPASIRINYLRTPSIDLLDRVKPGLSASGLDLSHTEAPAGEHQIKVSVQDSEGRQTTSIIHLTVTK